jgi:hypothetical protein
MHKGVRSAVVTIIVVMIVVSTCGIWIHSKPVVFALKLRYGSKTMRIDASNLLYDAIVTRRDYAMYPVWTYEWMARDRDIYTRIGGNKYLYYANYDATNSVRRILHEATNTAAWIRSTAIMELFDISTNYSTLVVPVLENTVRYDEVLRLRELAFRTLLTRSRDNDVEATMAINRLAKEPEWRMFVDERRNRMSHPEVIPVHRDVPAKVP